MERSTLALAVGLLFLAAGAAVMTGRWRSWYEQYRIASSSWYLRNMAFAYLPVGVSLVIFGIAASMSESSDGMLRVLSLGPFVLAFGAFVLSVLVLYRPPPWLKPEWLRMIERSAPVAPRRRGLEAFIDFLVFAVLMTMVTGVLILGGLLMLRTFFP